MTQNYTLNDLVRLVYREVSPDEAKELKEEMTFDYELNEEFKALQMAAQELPKVTFSPSNGCLNSILDYSRRSSFVLN
ncbi:MAG: hypothetical protein HKN76_16240 [Saprospiraceae bacterium]|nr:hypothetical protein [Saprospiraceae bacterium]